MLTDFDLSKQSFPPGPPTIVKSNSPHIVNFILYFTVIVIHPFFFLC